MNHNPTQLRLPCCSDQALGHVSDFAVTPLGLRDLGLDHSQTSD